VSSTPPSEEAPEEVVAPEPEAVTMESEDEEVSSDVDTQQ
jgi:hypothetical protein